MIQPGVDRPPAGLNAQQVFFPAAALFAAIAPWLLMFSMRDHSRAIADGQTHAQSMLFGYVGALIAGYLLGKQSHAYLYAMLALWLAGRVTEILWSHTIIVHICYAGFGLALAIQVAPKFWTAKKWRNRVIGPVIALITCFPILHWLLSAADRPPNLSQYSLVLLISLLMFFMGGRVITPALARAFADSGKRLPQRVQPYIEGITMALLMTAGALLLLEVPGRWLAPLTAVASLLILVRLYRWQPFLLSWRLADIWALSLGYLWLGLGLFAFSISLAGGLPFVASLHIITIGALGTLSSTIMLKLCSKYSAAPDTVYYAVVVLLAFATLCRFLTDFIPLYRQVLLSFAGSLWSINFVIIVFVILLNRRGIDHARL